MGVDTADVWGFLFGFAKAFIKGTLPTWAFVAIVIGVVFVYRLPNMISAWGSVREIDRRYDTKLKIAMAKMERERERRDRKAKNKRK